MNQKPINVSLSGDNTLYNAAGASNALEVFDYVLIAAGAVTVIIKDGSGTEFARYTFAAAGDGVAVGPVGMGMARFVAQGDLIINLSGAVAVTGHYTSQVKS